MDGGGRLPSREPPRPTPSGAPMAFDAPPPSDASPKDRKPQQGPHTETPPPSGTVTLGDQFVISTSDALPSLDGSGRIAWRATDRRHPSEPYAALICTGERTPRLEALRALRGVNRPGLLSISAFGPIDWSDGRQRLAVVC